MAKFDNIKGPHPDWSEEDLQDGLDLDTPGAESEFAIRRQIEFLREYLMAEAMARDWEKILKLKPEDRGVRPCQEQ